MMPRLRFVAALGLAIAFSTPPAPAQSDPSDSADSADRADPTWSLTTIEPDPANGFEHPYLLYLPASVAGSGPIDLLVEPNNIGKPDDDVEVHREAAEHLASQSSVGHLMSEWLGVPLLVPVFPRPMSDWQTYTHALDEETMNLDLQLIAMIDDARARLAEQGYEVGQRALFTGFSASGTFINRFVMMHPDRVLAAAAGGLNGIVMLPVPEIDGHRLPYPLGTDNLEQLTGAAFDLEAVNAVPQLYYMGAKDDNDAVQYDDAYSESERETIYATIGQRMQPDRWEACQRLYREHGLTATFQTFDHIGHGTDQTVFEAVMKFLAKARENATRSEP
jgi:hypothetical protein